MIHYITTVTQYS